MGKIDNNQGQVMMRRKSITRKIPLKLKVKVLLEFPKVLHIFSSQAVKRLEAPKPCKEPHRMSFTIQFSNLTGT